MKKVCNVLRYYLLKDENAFMYLLKEEALSYMEQCKRIGVCNTEGIENLLFHIDSYLEIPEALKKTTFLDNLENRGTKYLLEVEKERAVERDYICELLKELPIGFKV